MKTHALLRVLVFSVLALLSIGNVAKGQVFFPYTTLISYPVLGSAVVGYGNEDDYYDQVNGTSPFVFLVGGGSIQGSLAVYNSSMVSIEDGTVEGKLGAVDSSIVSINGGTIGLSEYDGLYTTSTVHINGGTINGGTFAFGNSVVNINGGTLHEGWTPYSIFRYTTLEANHNSKINISGGTLWGLYGGPLLANNGSKITITGGNVYATIFSFDNSAVRVSNGTVNALNPQDRSSVDVSGGMIGYLGAADNSVVNVTGGTFYYGLEAYNRSTINIRGGDSYDMQAYGKSTLNFYGRDLRLSNPAPYNSGIRYILHGVLEDGTDVSGRTVTLYKQARTNLLIASPRLSIDKDSLNFGNVRLGSSTEMHFTITNVGKEGTTLEGDIGTPKQPFQIVSGGGHFFLNAKQKHVVTVRLRGLIFDARVGSNPTEDDLHITSINDPRTPSASIHLTGDRLVPSLGSIQVKASDEEEPVYDSIPGRFSNGTQLNARVRFDDAETTGGDQVSFELIYAEASVPGQSGKGPVFSANLLNVGEYRVLAYYDTNGDGSRAPAEPYIVSNEIPVEEKINIPLIVQKHLSVQNFTEADVNGILSEMNKILNRKDSLQDVRCCVNYYLSGSIRDYGNQGEDGIVRNDPDLERYLPATDRGPHINIINGFQGVNMNGWSRKGLRQSLLPAKVPNAGSAWAHEIGHGRNIDGDYYEAIYEHYIMYAYNNGGTIVRVDNIIDEATNFRKP